jgi:hypothetical protein
MTKWRLLYLALPAGAVVLLLRYVLHDRAGKSGILQFSDSGPVITGAALVVGLMLTGVVADYKESEKLPSSVGWGLVGLEDYAVRSLRVIDKDDSWVHGRFVPVAHSINDWLYGRKNNAELWADYADINKVIDEIAKMGATDPYLHQLHGTSNGLSGALDRMIVIRDTSFVKAGYALLDILVVVVLGLMVVVDFPSGAGQYIMPAAISVVYVYMLLFIKDLDNPFGYGENNGKGSAADVDLTPWREAYALYSK